MSEITGLTLAEVKNCFVKKKYNQSTQTASHGWVVISAYKL